MIHGIRGQALTERRKYESRYGGCAQTTILAVFEALGLNINEEVLKSGTGLAGGLGLTGKGTCGALIGGAIVISYLFPRTYSNFNDPEKKRWRTYKLVRRLINRFVREYGSCKCRDVQKKIFGRSYNLWDQKQFNDFEKAGGHKDKCPDVVGKVAMWTVEMIMDANTKLKGIRY